MANIVTFDPVNLRIVEISTGGNNVLSVQEMYSEWKDWLLADATRLNYPAAFRYTGADPISESQGLGSTFFLLNGWCIRPAENNHRLRLTGNLFTDPAGTNVVVPTFGAFTVLVEYATSNLVDSVFVQSPDIQYSSFNGGVTLDTSSPYSGTSYPVGTPRAPVNNSADALAIMANRGFKTLFIVGDVTIDSSLNYTGVLFRAAIFHAAEVVLMPSANVTLCKFYGLEVNGTLDGNVELGECEIKQLDYVDGMIFASEIEPPLLGAPYTIRLSGSKTAYLIDCFGGAKTHAGEVREPYPIIDMGGSGSELTMRGYRGELMLVNKSGADPVSIDLDSGVVILDATITDGTITVRGVGIVINNSTGTTVVETDELVNPTSVANAVQSKILSDATPFPGANINAAISSRAAGGTGLTPTQATMLLEMYDLLGLDPTKPLVVSSTARKVPEDGTEINQTISELAGVVTVERQ